MKSYLISYDLTAPGRDYSDLYKKIKEYGTWARPLESVWIVKTNQTAVQIRDNLKAVLDSNDKLLVVGLSGEAAWKGISTEVSQWIMENL